MRGRTRQYFLHITDLFKQKNINFIKARIPINIIQYIELLLKTYESNNFKNKLTKTRSNYNQLSKDKNFSNTKINSLTKKMKKLNENKENYLKQKENLQKKINKEIKTKSEIEENYKKALEEAEAKYTTNLSEKKNKTSRRIKKNYK
jgi:chromosome segregation ATPase